MIYIFILCEDVKWLDGILVIVGDFVYVWQCVVDLVIVLLYVWYIELMLIENGLDVVVGEVDLIIFGILVFDDYIVVVQLIQLLLYFSQMVIYVIMFFVLCWVIEEYGLEWICFENIVINGVYILIEYVLQECMVCLKLDIYWDVENVIIEQIVLLVINDEFQVLIVWELGVVDQVLMLIGQYLELKVEYLDEVIVFLCLCLYYYNFNMCDDVLEWQKDECVCQVLSFVVDCEIIIEFVIVLGQFFVYIFILGVIVGFEVLEVLVVFMM